MARRLPERHASPSRALRIGTAFLFATAITAAAVILSSSVAAWFAAWRTDLQRAQRQEVRWTEAGLVAAAAQRWFQTPSAWGGSRLDSFDGVTPEALGYAPALDDARAYRTPTGTYRLFPIAARQWDTSWSLGLGDSPSPGVLIVGTGDAGEEAVAVLAVGAMIVHRLPRVPLDVARVVAQLPPDPPVDPSTPSAPMPGLPATRRPSRHPRPTRHRRTPRLSTQRLPERRRRERESYPIRS